MMDLREQRIVEIQASIARALIKMEGMKAENMQRGHLGQSMAYTDDSFELIISEEQIGYNDIIKRLSD